MRKGLLIILALALMLVAAPAYAQGTMYDMGVFSVGLGGGFSDDPSVGPFILSGKYWTEQWELGGEVLASGDTKDEYDQIGLAWLAYRYDIDVNEDSATYFGLGLAGIFEDYGGFENTWGPTGLVGWDADIWGLELKYSWFDPGVASFVVYYHFE